MADKAPSLLNLSEAVAQAFSAPPSTATVERYMVWVQAVLSAPLQELERAQQQQLSPTSPLQLLLPLTAAMRQLPFASQVRQASLLGWFILNDLYSTSTAERMTRLQQWRLLCRSQPLAIGGQLISHYPAVIGSLTRRELVLPLTCSTLLRWILTATHVLKCNSLEQRYARLQQLLLSSASGFRDTLTLHGHFCEKTLSAALLTPFATQSCSHPAVTKIPPPALRQLLSVLADTNANLESIIQWCQQHPVYTQLLLTSATDANRLGTEVTDIKQAILTHGMLNVGDILLQQTLQSQLTGPYFPLRAWSLQFMRLSIFIAGQLCARSVQYQRCQQQAELLLTLACSGLFTHSAMHTQMQPPSAQRLPFLPFTAPATTFQRQLRAISISLAKHWQVNSCVQSALSTVAFSPIALSSEARGLGLMLQLSLLWAQQWFINNAMGALATSPAYEQRALSELGLSLADKSALRIGAASLLQSPLL